MNIRIWKRATPTCKARDSVYCFFSSAEVDLNQKKRLYMLYYDLK